MEKKLERHNQTVLVVEGKPYSLVRELNPTWNYVCERCGLLDLCKGDAEGSRFWNLCTPEEDSRGWFFIEDWDIIKTPLVCYCTGCEMCTDSDKCSLLNDD